MSPSGLTGSVQQLRVLATENLSERPDGELLRAFINENDADAFTLLVKRHGPLVLRVCRRLLPTHEDAEDAFQATFLLLTQKAASIRKGDSLASWLHGAAIRVSQNARRALLRRRRHEGKVRSMKSESSVGEVGWREVQELLDAEIQRLPPTYRAPFVLRYLEDRSSKAGAAELGLTDKAFERRLARARERLQQRLTRRGISLAVVLAALALGSQATSATVPAALIGGTVTTAREFFRCGTGPAPVLAILKEVHKNMLLKKLKLGAICLMTLTMALGGTALLARRGEAPDRLSAAPVPEEKEGPAELMFISWRHVCGDIFLTDATGKKATRLTITGRETDYHSPVTSDRCYQPAWSPDGKKIAFAQRADNKLDTFIFVMDANGKNVKQLTRKEDGDSLPPADLQPTWSPDGKKIVFDSQRQGKTNLYIMEAEGKGMKLLTPKDNFSNVDPVWSPDGTKIAFRRSHEFQPWQENIFVMDADGSNMKDLTQLHTKGFYNGQQAWSPDGKKIAFCSNRDDAGPAPQPDKTWVYVMDADGSNVKRISDRPGHPDSVRPVWSPDGKKIAYSEISEGGREIVAVDADGTNKKRLTKLGGINEYVLWSPDGSQLAFQHMEVVQADPSTPNAPVASEIEQFSIYIVDANGENLKTIVDKDTKLHANPVDMMWKPHVKQKTK